MDRSLYDTKKFDLNTIDVRWSNLCNLSCVYCGPEFSSKWASELNIKITTPKEQQLINFKNYIFDNVYVFGRFTEGILYKRESASVPVKSDQKLTKVLKETEEKAEQTFGSIRADKVYFLSTNTNEPKPINFKKIDKYEPTQNNYIEDIDPNTYSLVRGEVLLKILKTMSNLFESHIHQPSEPLVKADPNYIELENQIKNLEKELLNRSIRIN